VKLIIGVAEQRVTVTLRH